MILLALVAVSVVAVVLVAAFLHHFRSPRRETTVPGLSPTTEEDGNLSDIRRAGSLHEFLMDLHRKFGPIASFWMGKKLVVSIASSQLFKEHQHIFDRPPELFQLFEPLLGSKSVQYANGSDGRGRRAAYDKCFGHEELKMYYIKIQKVADEVTSKWFAATIHEHIPLEMHMFEFALKSALMCILGDLFDNEQEVFDLMDHYQFAWQEMERRLADPVIPPEDSPCGRQFNQSREMIFETVSRAIEHRKKHGSKSQDMLAIDLILDHKPEETAKQDCVTYLIGSFHTTGNFLTWAFYFMACHQDVQEKVYQEVMEVLGKEDIVEHYNINSLKYLQQVLQETLRCAVVAPWAARFQDIDSELGGHKIPKGTPVIHALGVSLQNDQIWPNPTEFDPERFSPENTKTRSPIVFSPFGFAGRRVCPGYRFAYVEATIGVVTLIRKFKVELVPGQTVTPKYGLVTHPADEIWITLSKRT